MPELVGADTADFPNKGETPLNVHCVTVFPELRLDSVGLPPSTHNALTLYVRERGDQHFHSVLYLSTPPLVIPLHYMIKAAFWYLSCASFSCRSVFELEVASRVRAPQLFPIY